MSQTTLVTFMRYGSTFVRVRLVRLRDENLPMSKFGAREHNMNSFSRSLLAEAAALCEETRITLGDWRIQSQDDSIPNSRT